MDYKAVKRIFSLFLTKWSCCLICWVFLSFDSILRSDYGIMFSILCRNIHRFLYTHIFITFTSIGNVYQLLRIIIYIIIKALCDFFVSKWNKCFHWLYHHIFQDFPLHLQYSIGLGYFAEQILLMCPKPRWLFNRAHFILFGSQKVRFIHVVLAAK